MHPTLARALASIERAIAGVAPTTLERHPAGKWSAANILEHLALTFDGTRRNLQKCLETGSRRAARQTFRQRLGVLLVVELGHFPSGVEAPAPVRPTGLASDVAIESIRRTMGEMDGVMTQCQRRFGDRGAIANHPILGPLSLRQWRRFHAVHMRHHIRQIAALTSSAGPRQARRS